MRDVVSVRRHPRDRRLGSVPLEALEAVHWTRRSGGVPVGMGGTPTIAGYCYCDEFVSGGVAHRCEHGRGPHFIKVCITAKDNPPGVMQFLEAEAEGAGGWSGPGPVREMAVAA